jgi:hypothetical protein
MARPLRIERAGGCYHVTARGNERKNVFRVDAELCAAIAATGLRQSPGAKKSQKGVTSQQKGPLGKPRCHISTNDI